MGGSGGAGGNIEKIEVPASCTGSVQYDEELMKVHWQRPASLQSLISNVSWHTSACGCSVWPWRTRWTIPQRIRIPRRTCSYHCYGLWRCAHYVCRGCGDIAPPWPLLAEIGRPPYRPVPRCLGL